MPDEADIPDLSPLLAPASPSAMERNNALVSSQGVTAEELSATKDAVAAIGAAEIEPDAPAPSLRARVLASMQRSGRFGIFADRLARFFDISVADAELLAKKLADDAAWMPFLVPGVEMIPVPAGPKHPSAICTVVRFTPGGAPFPSHTHRGTEDMLVLDGGFREENEAEEFWRGDECHRTDGSAHALVALEGTPCIAAVIVHGIVDF